MKQHVLEKISLKINKYKDKDEAISSVHSEKRITDDYEGRQLLELIQNADDELTNEKDKKIRISFKDNYLEVCNNGNPFSKEGVTSLMYQDHSPKERDNLKTIGCKGLGFRSILDWADEISIDSVDLHIIFSEEISLKQLKTGLGDLYEDGMKATVLEFPEWNDNPSPCNYTTRIRIKVKNKSNVLEDIKKQFNNLDEELLLFLNRADELEIEDEFNLVTYKKTLTDNNIVYLSKVQNGNLISNSIWTVINKIEEKLIDNQEKRYIVSIAYKNDGSIPKRQCLYSYLPTNIPFYSPFLVHATFDLESNRNTLTRGSNANKEIIKTISKMIVEMAITVNNDSFGFGALYLLLSNWRFSNELTQFGIEEYLIDDIKNSNIFPTVNGEYINGINKPYYDNFGLSTVVKGEMFSTLLIDYSNRNVFEHKYGTYEQFKKNLESLFAEELNVYSILNPINEYIDSIRDNDDFLKILARISIILYKKVIASNSGISSFYIKLHVNENSQISNCSDDLFVIENFDEVALPDFLGFNFINRDYLQYLNDQLDKYSSVKNDFFKWFNLKTIDFKTIVDTLNSKISFDMVSSIDKAIDTANKSIKWLWNNKLLIDDKSLEFFYLPTRDGNVAKSTELFIGKEYENNLIEKLFVKVPNIQYVCNVRPLLNLDNKKNNQIINFLLNLGAHKFPIKKYEIKNFSKCRYGWINQRDEESDFTACLANTLKFPYKFKKLEISTEHEFVYKMECSVAYTEITHLKSILNFADTKSIIEWIINDDELKNLLDDKKEDPAHKYYESEYITCGIREACGRSEKFIEENRLKSSISYVKHLFLKEKWISINNQSYSVEDCIFDSEYENKLSPFLVSLDLNNFIEEEKNKAEIKNTLKSVFKNLGVVNNFGELPYRKIYEVLYHLNELDSKGKIVSKIYNSLINSNHSFKKEEIENIDNYTHFIDGTALVWTNHGYKKCLETRFIKDTSISNKFKDTQNFIILPFKATKNQAKIIFNIDTLKYTSYVKNFKPLPNNNDFLKQFETFKEYAFCFFLDNITDEEEIIKYSDLKLILCSQINASYSNMDIFLDDFEYIKDNEKDSVYYVKVPDEFSIKGFGNSQELAQDIADILCNFIKKDNEALNKDLFILYQCNQKNKEKFIIKETNDYEIIERARKKLNIIGNTKSRFLNAIERTSNVNKENYIEDFNKIDFNDLFSLKTAAQIINCFKAANIDIPCFEVNFEDFDIRSLIHKYYEEKIKNILFTFKEKYDFSCYEKLLNKSIKEKKKLCEMMSEFDLIKINIDDSVHFNPQKRIIDSLSISENTKHLDINEIYTKNKNIWVDKYNVKPDNLEIFLENTDAKSLVYYGEFDELNKLYNAFVSNLTTTDFENSKNDNTTLEVNTNENQIVDEEIIEPKAKVKDSKKDSIKQKSLISQKRRNAQKEYETGIKGEEIVYNHLLKLGYDVTWVSKFASDKGINISGKDGDGYDMRINSPDKTTYIEVKSSSTSDITFEITDNEYNFACSHHNDYEIYYVSNIYNPSMRKIQIIKNLFTEIGIDETKANVYKNTKYTLSIDI